MYNRDTVACKLTAIEYALTISIYISGLVLISLNWNKLYELTKSSDSSMLDLFSYVILLLTDVSGLNTAIEVITNKRKQRIIELLKVILIGFALFFTYNPYITFPIIEKIKLTVPILIIMLSMILGLADTWIKIVKYRNEYGPY